MIYKPIIWIVDTSIFTNVLNVPGRNQDRINVLNDFHERIENKDTFLLPYAAIVETGNHIAQLNGNLKYDLAKVFSTQVKLAIEGGTPWKPLNFPTQKSLLKWLDHFPDFSCKGISFGDFSIIKEWEQQKELFNSYSVRIWSLDCNLQGYES
ncbi:MAG TPA: hypothetical protein PK915_12785 [Bacteroidales bacterium]|nr:hypothetical protein [Bacteroidales bacterium]